MVTVWRRFTDHPSKSKLSLETIQLNVEPNAPVEMFKWLDEKNMNLKPSAITIWPSKDEGVDFVVNDLSPNPALFVSEPPLNAIRPLSVTTFLPINSI